jgi:TPR repeat protein
MWDKDWNRGKLRSALKLFRSAAKAGDLGALLNVGYFYQNGIGVRQNPATALDWYKRVTDVEMRVLQTTSEQSARQTKTSTSLSMVSACNSAGERQQ